jgi:TIR domain
MSYLRRGIKMKQVFLSHKTEEKTIVLSVQNYLTRCLISSWFDSNELQGGGKLASSIRAGLGASPYCLAFISSRYIHSNWCMHELEEAERHARNGKTIIIPVLLDPRADLKQKLNDLSPEHAGLLESVLERYICIDYDRHDKQESAKTIAKAIAKHQKIEFVPIESKSLDGKEVQLIQFNLVAGDLPTDLFQKWTINFEDDFLAFSDGEEKPIRAGEPVALNGKGPAWLYAHLTTGFKNLCPVYVFNNPSKEYICVYDSGKPPNNLGNVLKAS